MKSKPIFLIAFAAGILLNVGAMSSQETREVKKTVDLNRDGSVYIDTYKGSIRITTWEKPQVEINALIESDGRSRDEMEKVRQTEIRIDDSPKSLYIKTDYGRVKTHHHFSFFGLFDDDNTGSLPLVRYTICMPKTANLTIKDYKSDSWITGLTSSLEVNTYKGSVNVSSLEGSVDLETYKGDAVIDMDKLSGTSRLETYKGKIELKLPKDAAFKLDADLGRRADLDSDFEHFLKSKRHNEEWYSGSVGEGGPVLRISSEKGDIRLKKKQERIIK